MTTETTQLASLWDDAKAANMSEPEKLLYRSNLLGSDKRVTNYGGGNTSAKVFQADPLSGEEVEVLWVKGSGGDVGSIKMDGFSTLYMDKLRALKGKYRGVEFEDEMVGYLPHCTFNLNPRAASIDTPLHAYVPKAHVDHMHPDAIIAIAATKDSKAMTKEIFGDDIGWLPWKKPGYELGLWLEKFCLENPDAKGVVLESHGLFTWDDDAKTCYELTLEIINKAIAYFEEKTADVPAFGGAVHESLETKARREVAAKLMPAIRGFVSGQQHMVGNFVDSDAVLEFVNAKDMPALAALGTSCPDHFLRTKICPLVVDFDPAKNNIDEVLEGLEAQIAKYREGYAAYYDRCKHDDSPALRDPNAVVYLIPGVGMITFAKDRATARISGEFYVNAINVMRGASAVSEYCGLPEQEAFDIEYWLLEEAKLQRMPKPKSLAGQVALVTGGAGGIGSATAERYLSEGACVMLADINEDSLKATYDNLTSRYGKDVVRTVVMNVTDEDAVAAAYAYTAVEFGGVDILVSNAGIASSAPVEETTLDLWNKNMDILSTGYFLVSREAFKMMRVQDMGGSVVFVASKNGLAASPNAAAYCTAKASEIHLARCLALEGAEAGIRVNVVNPDAVLRGSKIWEGEWLDQRAGTYGTDKEGLEEMYRNRSMLKRSVLPEDIAEAAYFFASDKSAKSTGNIVNVDAGNVQAFTR
ncbi:MULTISPECIES: bifunctional rhamnulose-1-phosphate aldolase/short-chain dehydrogenase [Halocynthiibacter]|uniref:Bifunctional rhamnulose-1-phosphate aldolase/short-chain dehydrogenase n=1 Tax=Halocynthiibacter halioticoli TaxID=2986804 RepID=A0AAE3LUA9_9RHOB|nr:MULTISPECIES: bifunctional rhamnulose-1-phosphate aldolase/short-chain dehydrogenase [Halocynthiibacter]MCV6823455.1 bifunctional rhamnulose-1-phosphate aldolase/short-chain dehydrogenase [Halocynthiibacter halioticoli]MCW4056456.1 bifunctional rhamnulose-1-phosphate aldolase/short-chain dehydrogenase [Halocynthiibacter sp. SDUM655004]